MLSYWGRVVQRSGASCLKIGGELSGANCPGGELSDILVVAENLQNLFPKVSDSVYFQRYAIFFSLEGWGFDPLWSSNGWGIWPKFFKKVKCLGVCLGGGGGNGRFWNGPVHYYYCIITIMHGCIVSICVCCYSLWYLSLRVVLTRKHPLAVWDKIYEL